MDEILEFLNGTGKYDQLLSRWCERQCNDIGFEILFAYFCESNGLTLDYEVSANQENKKLSILASLLSMV
jgi:hypothetical protein